MLCIVTVLYIASKRFTALMDMAWVYYMYMYMYVCSVMYNACVHACTPNKHVDIRMSICSSWLLVCCTASGSHVLQIVHEDG